ncbi:FAD-dependent oxidoreductase [Streptomyces sp. VRA16 Mangrove soil]|uniref:FAD-dependent oxidoreductase n=1 Tax=Streptomyces sp. VRA16 Mangrove soil TaxID=2817434 RepID=UPI001A9CF6D7|nr:FAD-dependent oxidoreductase [Streptomyces sp. VRA16 Mangrove soil]MBO1329822.1 FAD-dependent oxidoreductase [Streptomyces sp. VRA16 Mangrove soil]
MPYVVTRSCCADASCVLACPVNCIHPAPGEPGFGSAEMLYVDPRTCVDCGACTTACPVDALKPHTALTDGELPFLELNAAYYRENPHADRTPMYVVPRQRNLSDGELSVAVIGAGPAGLFAADELLRHPGVRVTVYDRLPTPYGLVRAGVAPDHQDTKQVTELFRAMESQPGFSYRLGVEIGTDLTHADLLRAHHAVIYAVGAATDRRLGIEGEDLPGSVSATDFVAWYNGHPDRAHDDYALDCARAVVIGNGNVALDVARILTADPEALARTDISDRALARLRTSKVREVVLLGRRGPAQAAFTVPELLALGALEDVDVSVEGWPDGLASDATEKTRLLADLAARAPVAGRRRIVLRFLASPVRLIGDGRVRALEITGTELRTDDYGTVRAVPATGDTHTLETGLVLRSVGYRARPVPGLPFDEADATVPHEAGRVEPGVYVAGWIKRGPTGFIGTNKTCAHETVQSLLDDFVAGRLTRPLSGVTVAAGALDLHAWRAIDHVERTAGEATGRPRVKLTDTDSLRHAAAQRAAPTIPTTPTAPAAGKG